MIETDEMRLIDANEFEFYGTVIPEEHRADGGTAFLDGMTEVLEKIDTAPTIDPESLPIVRQLREELARVTAERDAAVKDRAELADYELAVCEQFCLGDREHDIAPCAWLIDGMCKLREWRGPQKEE